MLKEYLEKTYGCNEPIFINEIKLDNLNDNALRQYFKRMVKSGDLIRFDTGIYYLPRQSRLLKKSYLDPLKVVSRKYIQNGSEIFGYFSGAYLSNQLRLTTQMPATIEIVTNKESTKGRTVTIGGQSIRLKRPSTMITEKNVRLLQFLDAVSASEKYAELPVSETTAILKQYIRQNGFTKNRLADVLPYITAQTAKKLIEWGLIYEFA
ncbi:DUF6088 family protein [Marvinbryantia formatexigens]|nr:DUF6088 family protein [Marvinbryantia formatexigens]UWO26763.1 DUF6088 family protein [Marvinbryantia formatexigens DSM 14469]SDH36668.1 Transcriptional regulator, AbiEi antitoxin, Type IV TA system [Marvinbryantia formatexigens]